MSPLNEQEATRLFESFRKRILGTSSVAQEYIWEAIKDIEWCSETSALIALKSDLYNVIFDSNGKTMSARLCAARHFGCDDVPLGYRLNRQELLELSHQAWVTDADFYVFDSNDDSLLALRTHEDPDRKDGFGFQQKNFKK